MLTNMIEDAIDVEPVARAEGNWVLEVIIIRHSFNERDGLGFWQVQFFGLCNNKVNGEANGKKWQN